MKINDNLWTIATANLQVSRVFLKRNEEGTEV